MKYVLTALSTLCCFAAGLRAQNNSDKPELFEIVAQGDISTPIYRSPSLIPVHRIVAGKQRLSLETNDLSCISLTP